MLGKARTPNPHYPNAPSRMADGRLFTDYRANCQLIKQIDNSKRSFGASFEDKQRMQSMGNLQINTDRSLTVMKAGVLGDIADTMVPELTKRVCAWDGCTTLPAHAAGIGQGRLYLPGRIDLVAADPDVLAKATAFDHGTFSANVDKYMADVPHTPSLAGVVPVRHNRYSAPYGN